MVADISKGILGNIDNQLLFNKNNKGLEEWFLSMKNIYFFFLPNQ